MPKEQIRKRGKRKGKGDKDEGPTPAVNNFTELKVEEQPQVVDEPQAGPSSSGIHPARAALLAGRRPVPSDLPPPEPVEDQAVLEWSRAQVQDAEFPFGVLDPDLKAYFRTVDDQIRDWEGVTSSGEEREDRQIFLSSVLGELRGHELTVSTDPDTAVVLERLLPSLGDWGRRVVGDAFGDSWETLVRHRFGSHVAQTWFTLAADTLDRESKGQYPPQHHEQLSTAGSTGTLPTMTALFEKLVGLLRPSIQSLLTNPHASPPIRLLLIILTPSRSVPALDSAEDGKGGLIRSKKSGKYRKGQAVQGKSIFGDEEESGKGKGKARHVPDELVTLRKDLLEQLVHAVSPVEWQSMGLHAVGSAAVQLILDLEVEDGKAGQTGSLLDILTEDLVKQLSENATEGSKAQPYPSSLLTTATGSRLFESILSIAPKNVFDALWSIYFVGKTGKFAGHPFANFVTAKGVSRLDAGGIEQVIKECRAVAGGRGLIKTARTGVLQALVERASTIPSMQSSVVSLVVSAVDLPDTEKKNLVPALMTLKTWPTYQAIKEGKPIEDDALELPEDAVDADAEAAAAAAARYEGWKNRRTAKTKDSDLAPNMQGCLLLQGMVRLSGANEVVLESVLAQDVSVLLEYASSPIASHLLDAILTSPAVTPKYRRKLLMAFMGHYRALAEDRMGSRVADTIWAKADGFMKEKIAKSLIDDANALASHQYGRFLASKLDLHLLYRRPDEWRQKQLGVNGGKAMPQKPVREIVGGEGNKKEKKRVERDEIDDVFAQVGGKNKKSKV